MPRQTRISFVVGTYSTISPSGDGMKAGMIRPMPFSIQMPTIIATHAMFVYPMLRRVPGT